MTIVGRPMKNVIRKADDVNADVKVYDGRGKEEIKTDVDKVTLCLAKYRDAIKWRTDWIGILGIIITISLSIVASDFRGIGGLDGKSVAMLFQIGLVLSIIFLAYVMIYSYQHRDYAKIKKVIDELKTGTINCDRW
jgi:hypothetical protein